MRTLLGLLLCSVVTVCVAQQQTPSLQQRALAAYKTKDFATFLVLEKQLYALSPRDPRTAYNLACGEALVGHPAESVRLLGQLLAWGLDFDADKDSDFLPIYPSTEWIDFKVQLAGFRKPIVRSATAFTLPEKGLLAAGIAVDEKSGDTYVSSARERKIVKRSKTGVVSDFATEKDGLLAVSYLVIDPARSQLIASVGAVPFMRGYRKEDEAQTGIFIFDLATGKLVRKVFLVSRADQHLLNAAVVDRAGNVFVVDSASREIYRLRRSSSELELYISSVVFQAPQALVLSADERTLYVVDYMDGIWAMEVLSTDRRRLDTAPDVFTGGLLGLARLEDGFIGVQNGARPNRVVRFRLDKKGEAIASAEVLERNLPEYLGPAQGTLSGSDFIYIANSQLNFLDPKTDAFPEDKAQPTIVLRLPLGK